MSHRGLLLAPDRCGRRQAPAASGGVHRRPVGLEPVPGCGRSAVPVRRPASRPCRPGPEPVPTTTVGWRLVDLAGCKLMYEQRRPAKAGWPPRASGAGVGSRWQDVRRGRAGRVVLWGRTSRCRWRRWSYRPGQRRGRVRVRAAGVCGTELHFLDGVYPPAKIPMVLVTRSPARSSRRQRRRRHRTGRAGGRVLLPVLPSLPLVPGGTAASVRGLRAYSRSCPTVVRPICHRVLRRRCVHGGRAQTRDLGFVCFEPGDIWTEHYWRDPWYSIKEVHDSNGMLKGLVC
jgi:hypothetical protein